ncbi:MAG: TauD/TfdA family dioxygenase [Gammaproteobacteria bacterium]|nr:TauD/TfdA family dioxygenase [Gammaproteobacteria bacterium]
MRNADDVNAQALPDAADALMQPSSDRAAWIPEEMEADKVWLHNFTDRELTEIHEAVENVERERLDFLDIDRDAFPLPHFTARLTEVRNELLYGRGFVLFRGLDIDHTNRRRAALAFWGISMHLGDVALSQNANGHALGHVYDLGQTRENPLQRGPYSREAIPFHCDWCDLTGLCCLNPAKQGGLNSIMSSVTVYNEMLEHSPDLVEALTHPIYRDRRGETPQGMDEWYAIPVFNVFDGWFSANLEPAMTDSVERFDEVPKKSTLEREAIAEIQRICDEKHLSMDFLPGDIQFINNHTTFHSRSAYEDYTEVDRKRHLFRIWLKCFDGRPLSHWFYDRNGPQGTVDRPGGIVRSDTVLTAPLVPSVHR